MPGGRPRKPMDPLHMVREMAAIGCSNVEIAAALGITESSLRSRLESDDEFSRAIKEGREDGRTSLRRAQWRSAVEDNNATMQIWLGKQLLGQKDRTDLTSGDERLSEGMSRTEIEHRLAVLLDTITKRATSDDRAD